MRLPQDKILHIGTELNDGKVNVVAEWQGELVRCKDCVWGNEWNDKQIFCDRILMRLRETDFCSYGERREP